MQMVPGASSGGTHFRHNFPGLYCLSLRNEQGRTMSLQGNQSAAMVNSQIITVTGAATADSLTAPKD